MPSASLISLLCRVRQCQVYFFFRVHSYKFDFKFILYHYYAGLLKFYTFKFNEGTTAGNSRCNVLIYKQ